MCSYEHMTLPIIFNIRPISIETNFELSPQTVLPRPVRFPRLFDAILHAIQVGDGAPARVRIFDCDGRLADTLPIPQRAARRRDPSKGMESPQITQIEAGKHRN